MTRARRELIALDSTPYYHCISRCVRRAFLCGEDSLTGNNYEHRKVWVTDRLTELTEVFAIDICAYAVMSNHYHLVLRVDRERAVAWDHRAVIDHWRQLFNPPLLVERQYLGIDQSQAEIDVAQAIIEEWRDRLTDISWFMRSLNEHLARRANAEDRCKGRFWEGRFKSQALLDDAAVLTCMSYVDLNPVRAGIADTPEESDFTSIQQRIRQYTEQTRAKTTVHKSEPTIPLSQLVKQTEERHPNGIGFTLDDYLELVDWAGRAVREGKRGAIPSTVPPILARLGLSAERYLEHQSGHGQIETPVVIGKAERIRRMTLEAGRCFIKGLGEAKRLYRSVPV
jgi:REP element-mobilizing transposase RayT